MVITRGSVTGPVIHLDARVRAPKARVFEAWTQPELLRRWFFAEEGMEVASANVDLRLGGAYSLEVTRAASGTRTAVTGVFQQIHAGEKLVYTWSGTFSDDYLTMVWATFSDHENGSKIDLVHGVFRTTSEIEAHFKAWNGCLTHLGQLLA